jgi:hypothetical protein
MGLQPILEEQEPVKMYMTVPFSVWAMLRKEAMLKKVRPTALIPAMLQSLMGDSELLRRVMDNVRF